MANGWLFLGGVLIAAFMGGSMFEGKLSTTGVRWLVACRMFALLVGGALMLFGALGVPW